MFMQVTGISLASWVVQYFYRCAAILLEVSEITGLQLCKMSTCFKK